MRKACKIAALIIAAGLMVGCAAQPTEGTPDHESIYRVVERRFDEYDVIYDTRTGVMYHMSHGSYNRGTLTLLVNADGTPCVWEGWEE